MRVSRNSSRRSIQPNMTLSPCRPRAVCIRSGLNVGAASDTMTIETCRYCGAKDDPSKSFPQIMTKDRFKRGTLETARSLNVRLPVCSKCFNSIQSGVSPDSTDRASKLLMLECEKLNQGMRNRLRGGSLHAANIELQRLNRLTEQYDAIWFTIQKHHDFMASGSDCSRKHGRHVIARDVQYMNVAARFLGVARRSIGRVIALEYDEARRAANAFIRLSWVRDKVMQRDGMKCCDCSSSDNLTIDHIISVIRGGENTVENLQTLCRACNSRKSSS